MDAQIGGLAVSVEARQLVHQPVRLYIVALAANVCFCRESSVWRAGAGVVWALRLSGQDG